MNFHSKIVLICDENIIKEIKLSSSEANVLILPFVANEHNKSRQLKEQIEDLILDFGLKKNDAIIGIGGGITLDLSGFIASTLFRGVTYYSIPSTLLAMVDAAIGGKTGLNTQHGKNMIGSIYLPKRVYLDLSFLDTLPYVEFLNGLSEIIKYGIIGDEEIFDNLKGDLNIPKSIIEKCISLKIHITSLDLHDENLRKILNFGHTIGHAIEKASNYIIPHGIAVFYGMIIECKLSKSFAKHGDFLWFLKKLYRFPNLDMKLIDFDLFEKALNRDKKKLTDLIPIVTHSPLINSDCKEFIEEFSLQQLTSMTKDLENEFSYEFTNTSK